MNRASKQFRLLLVLGSVLLLSSALASFPRPSLAQTGQTCVQPPAGIVSWWPGEGNAKDIVGQNDGTLQGGTTFAPGRVGQAFSFDGVNDYIDVGDVDLPSTFTIEAWVNPNSLTHRTYVISKDDVGNLRSYYFAIQPDNTIYGSVRNSNGGFTQYGTDNAVLTPGEWRHIVMTYNDAAGDDHRMVFYVNGVMAPSHVFFSFDGSTKYDSGGAPENNQLSAKIGISGDGVTEVFDGLIDEVTLYNRALSDSEVQGLFDASSAGKCKPDTAPPSVNVSFPAPNGQNGWFITSPVVGSVTADDTTTGGNTITAITCTGTAVGSITGLGTPSASAALTVAAEGINNVSCTASNDAGNSGAAAGSNNAATIQIDMTAPTVSFIAPTNGALYAVGQVVPASYTCQDGTGSGIASCSGSVAADANLDTSAVGTKSVSVTATDQAGNQTTSTVSYQVVSTISMGPQAMEGDLKVSAGTTLEVGYDFTMPGSHPAANVTFVGAQVTFIYTCVGTSGSGSFTVPIADRTYADSLNSSAWYPSRDQHDPSVFQGSYTIPASLCGSGLVRLNQGGTFSSGIASTAPGYKVNVRWHYSANGSAGGWSGTKSIVPN